VTLTQDECAEDCTTLGRNKPKLNVTYKLKP